MSDLTRLEAAAAGLESLPADEETADYLGRLDKIIRTLQGHRKVILDELTGPVSGKEYRVVQRNKGIRSYNTRALLRDFARAGVEVSGLIAARALSYEWHWSELHRTALKADIGLRIAGHELVDGDEADHVGEVWQSYYVVEAVKG
jgi:hypothetical protein